MENYQIAMANGETFSYPADGSGKNIEVLTASATLTADQSGRILQVATDALTFTLPATKKGLVYLIQNTGADGAAGITISPDEDDMIMGCYNQNGVLVTLTGTDDKDVVNTKATANKGDFFLIEADGSAGWYVRGSSGIWLEEDETVTTASFTTTSLQATGDTNQIGNALKTGYNRVTGYTKFDHRSATVDAEAYVIQVRGYQNDISGTYKGVDAHVYIEADGAGYIRGVQGVAMVSAGVTATASWVIGTSGAAVVDGTMAGASYLVGLSGAIEDGLGSAAITASLVTSCWLDSQLDKTVTGVHNLLNMTNNGSTTMDEVIRVTAGNKIANLLTINTASGMVSANAATGSVKKIKINLDGDTYYINTYLIS